MLEKMHKSKETNHSFNKSEPEKRISNLLKNEFSSLKTQYRKEKYPHTCNFYIRELDSYIEYHDLWTHGGGPYNPKCIEHQERLKIWREKAKTIKFYNNAIRVWTKDDINKVGNTK